MMNCDYIVAVKREKRAHVVQDWSASLGDIPGLVIGSSSSFMVHVSATPKALREVQRRFGDLCHIELIITHETEEESHEQRCGFW